MRRPLRLHDGPMNPTNSLAIAVIATGRSFPFRLKRPEALMEPCYALQGNDVGGTIHLANPLSFVH